MKTDMLLSPGEARREYFHFLSTPFQRFIRYSEWKALCAIEVKPTPYVKKLIKLTGYPGKTEPEDVTAWVQGKLDEIWRTVNGWKTTIDNSINRSFDTAQQWIQNVFSTIGNVIDTIGGLLGKTDSDLVIIIDHISQWIDDILEYWSGIILGVIVETSQWIADIALEITANIDDAITTIGDHIGAMYQRFSDAIDAIATRSTSRFEVIGNIIIAAINGVFALASTIVTGIRDAIVTVVHSTERVITNLIDNIVKTVDLLITGVKDIIGGTINTLLDFLKWLWGEVTALLDKMFDFDIENLSTLFVTLAEAQKKAFLLLKERAETVQP